MVMENAPMKNWELTLYEMQRKPQEPITDGTKIAVSPRSLQSELMCPICLDILKVTMTTKECLHRFCSDCIVTALRNGNKECPTCRKKLVSKRSLRRDPNFDALIAKIYPDREEYEAHQNRVLAKLNKHQFNGRGTAHDGQGSSDIDGMRYRNRRHGGNNGFAATESVISEDDAASIAGSLNQRAASRVNSDAESGTMETGSVGAASSIDFHHQSAAAAAQGTQRTSRTTTAAPPPTTTMTVVPEIELMLQPLPPDASARRNSGATATSLDGVQEMKQENRTAPPSPRGAVSDIGSEDSLSTPPVKYIKVPSNATVDHLGMFLSIRFNLQRVHKDVLDNDPIFLIYYYNEINGEYVQLQPSTTIDEISRSFWSGASSLSLYYLREQSSQNHQ